MIYRMDNFESTGEIQTTLWKKDEDFNDCFDCKQKFTFFNRRHHCRMCGNVFCNDCCNYTDPTHWILGRICIICRNPERSNTNELKRMFLVGLDGDAFDILTYPSTGPISCKMFLQHSPEIIQWFVCSTLFYSKTNVDNYFTNLFSGKNNRNFLGGIYCINIDNRFRYASEMRMAVQEIDRSFKILMQSMNNANVMKRGKEIIILCYSRAYEAEKFKYLVLWASKKHLKMVYFQIGTNLCKLILPLFGDRFLSLKNTTEICTILILSQLNNFVWSLLNRDILKIIIYYLIHFHSFFDLTLDALSYKWCGLVTDWNNFIHSSLTGNACY